MSDKQPPGAKISIYLPTAVHDELQAAALRLDRSVSWLLVRAWQSYRATVAAMPGVPPVGHENP